jgi:hypothetical protein
MALLPPGRQNKIQLQETTATIMKRLISQLYCLVAFAAPSTALADRIFLQSYWQNTIGPADAVSVAIWSGGNESASSNAPCSATGFCLASSAIGQMTSSAPAFPAHRPGDGVGGLLSTNSQLLGGRAESPPGWFGYGEDYLLQGVQVGESVVLELVSTDFDAFLEVRLLEGFGHVDHDDNGGGGTGAGSISRIHLTMPDRAVLVRVTSKEAGATGYYQVSVLRSQSPMVWGFSPASGVPGTWVRVRGTNFVFDGDSKLTGVDFGGGTDNTVPEAVANAIEQYFDVQVPEVAVSGLITVHTFNGNGSSTNPFVVLGRLGAARREAGAGISFAVTNGGSNQINWVQTATSLTPPILWETVATNVAFSPGIWRYTNPPLPFFPQRFFRVSIQ